MQAVLFDLDDTLFDHRRSARAALAEVHRAHAAVADFGEFERHHSRYLEEMHIEVLAGRIGLDDARRERFRRVFNAIGIPLEESRVDAAASAYRSGYMSARRALDGAVELLEAVRPHARVGIVSNNLLEEQRDKLRHCGFTAFVDALIVSEETGMSKPDPAIFLIALERLGVRADDTVMLGDSWAADIVGATRAGIRAVWFNPERKPRPAEPLDIAEVHALSPAADLVPLLLAIAGRGQ
jgi:YjjG family noncanonical pyrimidine nucleotidase